MKNTNEIVANHAEHRNQYAIAIRNGDTIQAAFHLQTLKRLREAYRAAK